MVSQAFLYERNMELTKRFEECTSSSIEKEVEIEEITD